MAQSLYCLLTEGSFRICMKMKNTTEQPLNGNGQVQMIIIGNSIRLKYGKYL